ncbi:PREDICTED: CRIB domain-containing protein RIC10-like [Ipomoea nil]|uniref:CRIB domain-containing protein RIC10-like n=1 Tax=Ipomoea nil TaxID=35883 RepID=UPI000900C208|nr:PREDICTED: CRIB domain-containing protein RIC10-like [Ipomoea nil]XP_019168792.1 PREDICTED: CRIB domain-containing protein RIC10-like [Ipomoea nil]
MKGTFKAGFKYISSIFVVKEEPEIEIEIGGPTDVKHVAHIGWESQADSAPTWMNGFKAGPDRTVPSTTSSASGLSPWSSQESVQSGPEFCNEGSHPTEAPSEAPKKPKRKKLKSSASTASRSSARPTKPRTKLGNNDTTKPMKVEVATY